MLPESVKFGLRPGQISMEGALSQNSFSWVAGWRFKRTLFWPLKHLVFGKVPIDRLTFGFCGLYRTVFFSVPGKKNCYCTFW